MSIYTKGAPITICQLLDVIHFTIIKHEGKNDVLLQEINSILYKIQKEKIIPDHSVEETEQWIMCMENMIDNATGNLNDSNG